MYNSQYNKKEYQSVINRILTGHQSALLIQAKIVVLAQYYLIWLIILADNSGRYLTDNSDQPKFSYQ